MARDNPTLFAEFMGQLGSYYPGFDAHRRKPHNDPEYCEACLFFIRRPRDRVRYLGKVVDPRSEGRQCLRVTS